MQTVTPGLPICLSKVAGRRDAGILAATLQTRPSEGESEKEGGKEGRRAGGVNPSAGNTETSSIPATARPPPLIFLPLSLSIFVSELAAS